MITRRGVLSGIGASAISTVIPNISSAATLGTFLAMPPLLDSTRTGRFRLEAQSGRTNFLGQAATETWGFNQSYLGPTIRIANKASVQAEVENNLSEEISVHWHGMIIPGDVDGGPHQPIASGSTWSPELPIDQAAATIWYHTHIHGETARQVYKGLAGVLQLSDGLDDERGLPSKYGLDDLTLVLQDRRFDRNGRMDYSLSMPDQMMGFLGDTIVVNGQVGATAVVPKGIARLRLLNGSNSRIYGLTMSDNRPMHLIAADAGLLDRPIELDDLTIAPGERYEVLVDFSNGRDVSLVSRQNTNTAMMRRTRTSGSSFEILPFKVDTALSARIAKLPQDLGGSRPDMDPSSAKDRRVTLDMQMGPGMMMRRSSNRFSINGQPFDMQRMDFTIQRGTLERWSVSADMMMHPLHVHGVKFQVLSENGRAPSLQNSGWKDTVLIDGRVELLMKFDQPASESLPFMFHCHILEHEDSGMMGQFSVV